MDLRDLGAADLYSPEFCLIDEPPCCRAGGVLEERSGAGMSHSVLLPSQFQILPDLIFGFSRIAFLKCKEGCQDDITGEESQLPVTEFKLFHEVVGNGPLAQQGQRPGPFEDARAVGPGIHLHGPAYRAGDAGDESDPPQALFLGKPYYRQVFRSGPGQEEPLGRIDQFDPGQSLQRDYRSPDPAVPNQQVVAAADDKPGDILDVQPSNQPQQVRFILRDREDIRRPPDFQRGVPG